MTQEAFEALKRAEWDRAWEEGGIVYADKDYVEGSHPMDIDGAVTWHHIWAPPPAPIIKKDGDSSTNCGGPTE